MSQVIWPTLMVLTVSVLMPYWQLSTWKKSVAPSGLRIVVCGYNGGHQAFQGVSMYQNGGQIGVMSTLSDERSITSILAYIGAYFNEMSLEGAKDKTGNYFAG